VVFRRSQRMEQAALLPPASPSKPVRAASDHA
jgi:hypothetical protein